MKRVLLTGATGFLGSSLAARLLRDGHHQLAIAVRQPAGLSVKNVEHFSVPDLTAQTSWQQPLAGREVVIHAAARVHVMRERSADPLSEFRKSNVQGTLALARQAAAAGVGRFIFISSIKVNGEGTERGRPYTADDLPAPLDPYGISKLEAEQGLLALGEETGMQIVIIRPVLMYGPGVKANFRSMMNWLDKGIPLPLGAIHNRRSLLAVDNLADLIVTCIEHPAAAGQVFLASDGEDLSTTELLRRMARALGKPARLLPVPESVLYAAARLLGRQAVARRLCGSLQVDIEKTRQRLGWSPPVRVDDALASTARHFLDARK